MFVKNFIMRKHYYLALLLIAALSFGQNFTAVYDFSAIPTNPTNGLTDPTPPPIVTGLSFNTFTAVNSGSNLNSASDRFSYAKQPIGAVADSNTYTDHIGNLDKNTYFTFTITPTNGTVYDLSRLTFKSQRSSTGIRTFAVKSSLDDYTSNLTASSTSTSVSVQPDNIFYVLSDANTNATNIATGNTITFQSNTNISEAVTFRIYGWNAETAAGTFSVDDVTITGTITTPSIEQNEILGLRIYPSTVAQGLLYFSSETDETKSISIFEISGKEAFRTEISGNNLNLLQLKSGLYFIKISVNGKITTQKIIIK